MCNFNEQSNLHIGDARIKIKTEEQQKHTSTQAHKLKCRFWIEILCKLWCEFTFVVQL